MWGVEIKFSLLLAPRQPGSWCIARFGVHCPVVEGISSEQKLLDMREKGVYSSYTHVFAARWFDDRTWPMMLDVQFASVPNLLKPWLPNYVRGRILKSMAVMEFIRAGQDECWRMFQDHLDQLEGRAPIDGFWVGDHVTVADISLFGVLHCRLRSAMSPWQKTEINARPQLRAWLDRVDAATQAAGL